MVQDEIKSGYKDGALADIKDRTGSTDEYEYENVKLKEHK
jgi:hypothetical protein